MRTLFLATIALAAAPALAQTTTTPQVTATIPGTQPSAQTAATPQVTATTPTAPVPQTVSTRGGKFRPHFDGATPQLEGLVRGILEWKHAPRFTARMSGMWQTLRGLLAVRRRV